MTITDLSYWLERAYDLRSPIACTLLRAYTNDVYLVTTHANSYVLKIYGLAWRAESEIEYETALLDHLTRKGLRVANAVAGRDSRKIYPLLTPRGRQYAVLFDYAAGKKPHTPFSGELYYAFGQAIARMHELSNDFVAPYAKKPLDFACLLDAPLALVLPLAAKAEDRIFLQGIADEIKVRITDLSSRGLDWGPIHGDATLDNLHVTREGDVVLYDLDSGGPGWRAADLQGWAKNQNVFAAKWQAFKNGYAIVRELKAPDLEASSYMSIAWLIWGLQIDLEQRVLKQGKEKVMDYLDRQIGLIRASADRQAATAHV